MQHDKAIEAATKAYRDCYDAAGFNDHGEEETARRVVSAYLAARRASLPHDVPLIVKELRALQDSYAGDIVMRTLLGRAARLIEELAAKDVEIAEARDKALEEAAQCCETFAQGVAAKAPESPFILAARADAARIRALKAKED